MVAKQPADTYTASGLDLDYSPFTEADFEALGNAVQPTAIVVSQTRFSNLLIALNKAARAWKLLRDIHTAPTDKQEQEYVASLGSAATRLSKLLNISFDNEMESSTTVPVPPTAPVPVPFEDGFARAKNARLSDASLPEDFPDDPTADGAWSVPVSLDRLVSHFDRHYHGDGSESRHFTIPEEALHELAIMVRALAAGASHRLAELNAAQAGPDEPLDGTSRGNRAIILDGAKSPNHALFWKLVPIYEELFDRQLGVSRESPSSARPGNAPSGPALKFYQFVFDRIDAPRKGRADETILEWIDAWKADRNH